MSVRLGGYLCIDRQFPSNAARPSPRGLSDYNVWTDCKVYSDEHLKFKACCDRRIRNKEKSIKEYKIRDKC